MFSKKNRLPIAGNRTDFRKVYAAPYFLLKLKGNNKECNRFAIIISAKTIKKSTRRHYWRRRMAENLKSWPNFRKDFLVIVSPKTENADKKIIKDEFGKMLKFLISQS